MIRLTEMNEMELEQFERRIKKGFYQKGVRISYAEGNYGNEVHKSKLGQLMWNLHESGIVALVQRKIGFERFQYEGEVN